MEMKELGGTGVMVPEIGLGTFRYQGGEEPLRRGIALGASLIDTAEMYNTEGVVGSAVKGVRDQVFIATKVSGSHLAYDEVMRAAEASLRRLEVDHIDLYQIHWPSSTAPIAETMRAMEALVDSGTIRHIGVSNFSVEELREAQRAATRHPIVANQVRYSLTRREIERNLISYCEENQVSVIAYTPLDTGSLARDARFLRSRAGKTLGRVASKVGKTRAQVALNWCNSRPNVISIPKSNTTSRTEENCGASGWRLSSEQVRLLDEAFAK